MICTWEEETEKYANMNKYNARERKKHVQIAKNLAYLQLHNLSFKNLQL